MTICTCCGDSHSPETTTCPRTGQPVQSGPCGTRVARYEIERLLGDGGMGAVYRAKHTMLNQPVAIKFLHAEFTRRGDMLERFVREARSAASIGNPHIVRVSDCDVAADGRPFIVMELLEGDGLERILARERRITAQRTVALVTQMLDGLGAAHAAGIVHRDMKPANVFVRRTPDPLLPEFVTILDFGISKVTDPGTGENQHLTQTGAVIGTPIYMAPEQIMNPKAVDHRVDIYATGVIVYEMLSGRLPYDGSNTAELIVKACTVPPTPLREVAPDVPNALIEVVDRALAREPEARWQTTGEFAEALRRSLGGLHALPTSPQGSNNAAPPKGEMPATVAAMPAYQSTPNFAAPQFPSAPAYQPQTAPTAPPATPAHWGAVAPPVASNLSAPANMAHAFAPNPPVHAASSPLRVVGIIVGVIAALSGACCVGSIALGWFASTSDTESTAQAPQTPQTPQLTPTQPPQHPTYPAAPGPQLTPVGAPEPQLTPMGAPNQLVPSGGEAVHFESPQVIGTLAVDGVEEALARALAGADRCRGTSAETVSVLAIVQPNGRVAIARPADDNHGDASVAQCVANRFSAAGPVRTGGGSGIVRFRARLAAR